MSARISGLIEAKHLLAHRYLLFLPLDIRRLTYEPKLEKSGLLTTTIYRWVLEKDASRKAMEPVCFDQCRTALWHGCSAAPGCPDHDIACRHQRSELLASFVKQFPKLAVIS